MQANNEAAEHEAFEATIKSEGRGESLHFHPLHDGVYEVSETTRRLKSFRDGIVYARAQKPDPDLLEGLTIQEWRDEYFRRHDDVCKLMGAVHSGQPASSDMVESFEKACGGRNKLHLIRGDKIRPIDLAKRHEDGIDLPEYHNPETERLWCLWREATLSAIPEQCELEKIIARQREEISELREQKFRRFNDEECWIHQSDGDNHPESLICPVVMSADQYRTFMFLAGKTEKTYSDEMLEKHSDHACMFNPDTEVIETRWVRLIHPQPPVTPLTEDEAIKVMMNTIPHHCFCVGNPENPPEYESDGDIMRRVYRALLAAQGGK